MKKLALTLLASLAFVSFANAATSGLTESLLEYEAITNAIGTDPNFENVISANEFIVDIERITRKINVIGTVKYEIVTKEPKTKGRGFRTHIYIATLLVAPNPAIGPNIVTVVSIIPAKKHKSASDIDADL